MTTTTSSPGRQFVELTIPGASIGLGCGIIAGGVALLAGLPADFAATTAVTLGVPLALFGMGYFVLLARGKVRLGVAAPAVLYWLPLFPLARLIHEVSFDMLSGNPISLPDALIPFLAFQTLLSAGFAIGFVWLNEHVVPRWWIRIRDHNPVAEGYVQQYLAQTATTQLRAERKKQRV